MSENGLSTEAKLPGAPLKRIWHIAPGAADEPGVVWLGADPGVLFRSNDNGENWEVVEGLTNHPSRSKWTEGGGGMMVHSIQALGKGRVIAGISAAGAFRTTDSGRTWEPFNGNVLADFQPVKFPEVGQCVHKLLAHPRHRDALYQQNHCGIYRARFTASKWQDISKACPAASDSRSPCRPRRSRRFSRFRSSLPASVTFPTAGSAWRAAGMRAKPGSCCPADFRNRMLTR